MTKLRWYSTMLIITGNVLLLLVISINLAQAMRQLSESNKALEAALIKNVDSPHRIELKEVK